MQQQPNITARDRTLEHPASEEGHPRVARLRCRLAVRRDERVPAEDDRPAAPPGPASPARPPRLSTAPSGTQSSEQVLIQSNDLESGDAGVQGRRRRRRSTASEAPRASTTIVDPYDAPARSRPTGTRRSSTFELPGDSDVAEENVDGSLAAVAAAQKAHPELRIERDGRREPQQGADREVERGDGQVDPDLAAADPDHPRVRVRRADGGRHPAAARADQRRARRWACSGPVSQIAPVDGSVMQVVAPDRHGGRHRLQPLLREAGTRGARGRTLQRRRDRSGRRDLGSRSRRSPDSP